MNYNKNRETRGITLIALVVTIIVLLILAGISISMLTGQNGILNRAAEAKKETENVQTEEQIKLVVITALTDGNGTLTIENLKKEMENNGIKIENIEDFPITINIGEKSYIIEQTGEVSTIDDSLIPEGLQIGSKVLYEPSGTYNWQGKYCSTSEEDVTLSSASGESFYLKEWKVLSIKNGKVELVPTIPTTGTVYLGQAQGYNNGVKLLNDACNNLYGGKCITARSLNIDDIEKYMQKDKLNEAHEYTNEVKYNKQATTAYTKGKNYPTIYAYENKSVINGTEKTNGLDMSEQTIFIEQSDKGGAAGKISTATNIQPYQTAWYKDNEYMKNAFKTAINGVNYYDLLIKTSTNYWLASRCIDVRSNYCFYNMGRINNGDISGYYMMESQVETNKLSLALFPVVSLNADCIGGNVTDGFSVIVNN